MRNAFGENPESRMNRAITRTSSPIVGTPKAACGSREERELVGRFTAAFEAASQAWSHS
jgi:hypothetical protein